MAKRDGDVVDGDVETVSVVANGREQVSVPADVNTPGAKVVVKGITIHTY